MAIQRTRWGRRSGLRRRRTVACILAALVVGCAGTSGVQVGDTSSLPADRIATVFVEPGIAVASIDGDAQTVAVSTHHKPLTLTLAPGFHRLEVRYQRQVVREQGPFQSQWVDESDPIALKLNAVAGTAYVLEYDLVGQSFRPLLRYARAGERTADSVFPPER